MKKLLYLVICLLLAVSVFLGCGAQEDRETAAPAKEETGETTEELPVAIWNHTGLILVYIDIKSSESEAWPDEWANSDVINPDESCEILLGRDEKALYDIELVDENEDVWSLLEVPLAPGSEILVFDDQTAWTIDMDGEEVDLDVIFTNTENEEDYVGEALDGDIDMPQENSPVGVWEIAGLMDDDASGEMELLADGTLITRPKGAAEFETTYSVEGDVVTLHFDDFDLEFTLDGDTLFTSEGSEYAHRK